MSDALDRLTSKQTRSKILWYNAILYILLLSQFPWGINITIFEVLHLLPYLISWKKLNSLTIVKAVLALIISVLFWNRSDIGFHFISIISLAILNYLVFYEIAHDRVFKVEQLTNLVALKIKNIVSNLEALFSTPNIIPKRAGVSENTRKILFGLIIALPVVLLLISLFASADSTFQSWTEQLNKSLGKFFTLEFLKLDFMEMLFSGFFFGSYLLTVIPTPKIKNIVIKRHYLVELLTVTALVSFVFGLFIISQYKNVHTIINGFNNGSLNPSEFVREGFYQMSFAVVIAFGVLYLVNLELVKKVVNRLKRTSGYLTGILFVEIAAVIILAFQRVWAYQFAYGYTQLRLWGIFIVVWLMGIALLLAGRLYRLLSKQAYIQAAVLFSAVVVLTIGLINVDRTVASVKPPTVNSKIDYAYIGNTLSYDAAPEWERMLVTVEKEEYELLKGIMNNEGFNIYRDSNNQIQEVKFSRTGEYNCKVYDGVLAFNSSVSRGKKIVCDNIDNWKNQYINYLNTSQPDSVQ